LRGENRFLQSGRARIVDLDPEIMLPKVPGALFSKLESQTAGLFRFNHREVMERILQDKARRGEGK
jgi:hypothetical protein